MPGPGRGPTRQQRDAPAHHEPGSRSVVPAMREHQRWRVCNGASFRIVGSNNEEIVFQE